MRGSMLMPAGVVYNFKSIPVLNVIRRALFLSCPILHVWVIRSIFEFFWFQYSSR